MVFGETRSKNLFGDERRQFYLRRVLSAHQCTVYLPHVYMGG
jgi:hypothetical protein